ncbi:MAG: Gfo/Idh/MocA family oxidoreductase [Bdellovibrionales bacterium]|nr:Gfo/Idh/MocA family oxidoreductase [Bdellovibrionales bacterium]
MGSKNDVRFAVVGAGHMGSNHIKKILAIGDRIGARVSVIVEPDELRATALAREFPENSRPRTIANVGQISSVGKDDFPDVAIVAVPASIHVETTSACLAKGLHCLVEKPLGFSALDCRDLEEQALKAGKILQVGLLERWSLSNLWKDWKPKQGPWTINSSRVGPFVPRAADTDVIHDLMIHDIDMFVLLDSIRNFPKITKVRAWGRKLRSNLLDYAIVALDLEDGGMARFFASRLSAESHRTWEMTGPDWHCSIDFMRRTLKRFERAGRDMNAFVAHETQWTSGDPLGLEIETMVQRVRGTFDTGLAKQMSSFCSSATLIPTPQNVLRTHEIIDEILSCIKVLE